MKLALQTFTVRKEGVENLQNMLQNIKEIGYSCVELSRVDPTMENAKIILNSGINVLSLQLKFEVLSGDFENVVAFMKKVNCKVAEISVMRYRCMFLGEKSLLKFCGQINELSKRFNEKGLTLAYHHHDFEFKKINGKDKLQIILENTDNSVKIVSDTYWSKVSKFEPHTVLERISDRLIAVHLRDYQNVDGKISDCAVGQGEIDFYKVVESASKFASYLAVEQKTLTPYIAIKTSLDYIKANLTI